jgi:hypothetical protein
MTYNAFPRHLQEDWSGFNTMDDLNYRPVPVGAVVPKFYGYHVPDGEEEEECVDPNGRTEHMLPNSPILLLEECGEPIDPSVLTEDER